MATPLLVVVSGLPGSGKSTFAVLLASRIGAAHLSRDRIILSKRSTVDRAFERLTSRRPSRLIRTANEKIQLSVVEALGARQSVVVDVVADQDIRHQLQQAAALGDAAVYSIELICSDPEEHLRRLQSRPGSWPRVVKRMGRRYEAAPGALVLDSIVPAGHLVDLALDFLRTGD